MFAHLAVPPIHCVRIAHSASAIVFALVTFVFVLGATFSAFGQGAVQGVPNAMQGFSQNRNQPIQIEAATLEMVDKKKEATFSGNVKVVQGDTTMTSKTLVVFYESDQQSASATPVQTKSAAKSPPLQSSALQSSTPGPGGSSSIKRLEARGHVVVTHQDKTVTGDIAVFDTRANLITMRGGVVLTQCSNVLRGDRLIVDMTTGVSRVESDSGKVTGMFNQKECAIPSPSPGNSAPPSRK